MQCADRGIFDAGLDLKGVLFQVIALAGAQLLGTELAQHARADILH